MTPLEPDTPLALSRQGQRYADSTWSFPMQPPRYTRPVLLFLATWVIFPPEYFPCPARVQAARGKKVEKKMPREEKRARWLAEAKRVCAMLL